MKFVQRLTLRIALRRATDQLAVDNPDIADSINTVFRKPRAITALVDKVEPLVAANENEVGWGDPLPTPAPVTPTDPSNPPVIKHPLLKFIYDHREEILAFVKEIIALFMKH